jgi:hypothetical protein
MSYRGRPPPEGGNSKALTPGVHEVSIVKVKTFDEDYLVVFADAHGEEAVQVVPWDINPETNKKKAWIFWRLAGAFDYPDIGYWSIPQEARPERDWDVFDTLNAIEHSGQTCMVEVESYVKDGKEKASIKAMWSPRRDQEKAAEPATKKAYDTEVPF